VTHAFTRQSYRLVEAAAAGIADAVLAAFPKIISARVTVHKPHAPIAAIFNDVGVSDPAQAPWLTQHGRLRCSTRRQCGRCARHTRPRRREVVRRPRLAPSGARSSDYRTPPWGVTDQPAFVNLALVVETALAPRALLAHALAIEAAFGRDRAKEQRWGPRTLDIDIIAYDDIEIDEPGLTLPHPRLFERAFVLAPLAEIAPDRRIKGKPGSPTRWHGSHRAGWKSCRRAATRRMRLSKRETPSA